MKRLILILLLFAGFVQSAVTYDTSSSTTMAIGGGGTKTWSHTTADQENRLMLVGISSNLGGIKVGSRCNLCDGEVWILSVTYDGVPLEQVYSVGVVDVWMLYAPHVGTHYITVTFVGTCNNYVFGVMGATTFYGVDQSAGIGSYNSSYGSTSPIISTISGASADNMLWDAVWVNIASTGATITPVTGQTQNWNTARTTACSDGIIGASSYKNGLVGTTTLNWTESTNKVWNAIVVEINASATVPASSGGNPAWNSTTIQAAIDEEDEAGRPWYAWLLQLIGLWK